MKNKYFFAKYVVNNFSFEQKQEPVLYFHLVGEIPLSFEISVYAILLSDSISWLFRVWHALRNKCLCGSLGHRFAPRRVERLGWRTIKKIHNTHKYTDYRTRLWSKVASMPRKLPPNCRGSMRAAFRGVKSQLRSRITRDDWQFGFNRILIPSLITWRYLRRRKKKRNKLWNRFMSILFRKTSSSEQLYFESFSFYKSSVFSSRVPEWCSSR